MQIRPFLHKSSSAKNETSSLRPLASVVFIANTKGLAIWVRGVAEYHKFVKCRCLVIGVANLAWFWHRCCFQEEKTCSYSEGLLVPVSREEGEGQAMRAAQPLLLLLLLLLPVLYCWPGGASREAGGRGGGPCFAQANTQTEGPSPPAQVLTGGGNLEALGKF